MRREIARTVARGRCRMMPKITRYRMDGIEITWPAAASFKQAATRSSASSQRIDGMAPVRIDARWWNKRSGQQLPSDET